MTKSYIRSVLIAASVALATLTTAGAQAQELRIGYVNGDRVLRDAAPAKAALAKLEAEFGKRDRELNETATRLKTTADRLEKDAPTLTESERGRRQRDLLDQDRDLQRRRREFQEDFAQRKNEETQVVLERANKAIKQIFEQEKYDLIVQDAVFASARVDITDKVIRALNTSGGR
jgi:outer membrane protein